MSIFLEQQEHVNEANRVEEQEQLTLDAQEEVNYQMAVAQSLDLSYISPAALTPVQSTPSKSQLNNPSVTISFLAYFILCYYELLWCNTCTIFLP